MTLIYILIVAHWIGDFVCQSDWMAIHKSKRWDALFLHVLTYVCVLVFVPVSDWVVHIGRPLPILLTGAVTFLVVNAVAHFLQDAITSRISVGLWCDEEPMTRAKFVGADAWHWPLGADQLLHYLTLFVTADWWLR